MKRKKKLLCLLIFIIIFSVLSTLPAKADSVEDQLNQLIDDSLEQLDFSEVDKLTDGNLVSNVIEKIKQILNGDFDDASDFFAYFLQILTADFKNLLPSLMSVLVVCILCGIVTQNKSGLISENTGNIIYFVCFSIVLTTVGTSIFILYRQVDELLTNIAKLTDICAPILVTLMIANGNNVTASVYQPSVAMFSGTAINIISNVILPLFIFAVVFKIISSLSENIKVSKMSAFLTNTGNWLLGIVFMVFSAFMSVQGISAMTIDGISIRAAKFATKSYIPILGGYLADGFDLIVASSTLIKNAFGMVSLLLMVSYLLTPLISIIVFNLGLQAVSAVCEPLTDKRFTTFFSGISKSLTFLAVLVIAVAFMFFILIMLAIFSANV